MTNPLDTLLTAVFADSSPEGGGYAAAPLPLAPWVRLVKGALEAKGGSYGHFAAWSSNPVGIAVRRDSTGNAVAQVARGNIRLSAYVGTTFLTWPSIPATGLNDKSLQGIFSDAGYTTSGYTLRAQSPTHITLSLSGETVTAEFSPPLQATAPVLLGLVKATRPIPRIKATERQLTIEIDGYSDQVIPLCEPTN